MFPKFRNDGNRQDHQKKMGIWNAKSAEGAWNEPSKIVLVNFVNMYQESLDGVIH